MTRRGFTITEMLTVLGLLGLIGVAGGYLFTSTVRLTHATGESRNAAAGFDACIEALRGDVWSASKFDLTDERKLTLEVAKGTVSWSIGEGGVIRRLEGQPDRRWTLGEGATFAIDGVELIIRLPQTKTQRGGEVRLPSQIQLLSRESSRETS